MSGANALFVSLLLFSAMSAPIVVVRAQGPAILLDKGHRGVWCNAVEWTCGQDGHMQPAGGNGNPPSPPQPQLTEKKHVKIEPMPVPGTQAYYKHFSLPTGQDIEVTARSNIGTLENPRFEQRDLFVYADELLTRMVGDDRSVLAIGRAGDALGIKMEEILSEYPSIGLVITDTLQTIEALTSNYPSVKWRGAFLDRMKRKIVLHNEGVVVSAGLVVVADNLLETIEDPDALVGLLKNEESIDTDTFLIGFTPLVNGTNHTTKDPAFKRQWTRQGLTEYLKASLGPNFVVLEEKDMVPQRSKGQIQPVYEWLVVSRLILLDYTKAEIIRAVPPATITTVAEQDDPEYMMLGEKLEKPGKQ